MTTRLLHPQVTVEIDGDDFAVLGGSDVTLDAWAVPYARATVDLPLLDDATLGMLDPRSGDVRVPVTGGPSGGVLRTFDLGLREREVDHDAKTVTLTLASDEALAQDYAPLADDEAPFAVAGSLRTVCDYVIGKVTGNLQGNTNAAVDTTGWTTSSSGGATVTLTQVTGITGSSTASAFRATLTAGSPAWFDMRSAVTGFEVPVSPGDQVTARSEMRASLAGKDLWFNIEWRDASHSFLATGPSGAAATTETAWSWSTLQATAVAPAGAAYAYVVARITNPATGDRLDVTGVKIGKGTTPPAALTPTSTDADVTPYWELTNLHPNPTMAVGIGSYLTGGGCTIAWNSATGAEGSGFLRAAMSSSSGAVYLTGTTNGGYSITPGRSYTLSIATRSSNAGASMTLTLRWFNSDSQLIRTDTSSAVSVPTAWGNRFHTTATAPVGAARVVPFATISGTASGRDWDIDAVMLTETDRPVPFFHGGSSGGGYTYAWDDAANASQSVRTPDTPRDPDSLVWRAGQTAWDFLAPMCASVGMMLWCDEQRAWRLQTPESRTIADLISVTASNTRTGTDTLSREDTDTYVTGVVCRYRWTDRDGIAREVIDSAGVAGKVLVLEFDNTASPGPGLASATLDRRTGSGRSQDVTTITSWDTTPGMTAAIALPGAPETLGRVAAVTFHTDGFMDLKHAGIIDIIPGSITTLTGTIDALAGTIDAL